MQTQNVSRAKDKAVSQEPLSAMVRLIHNKAAKVLASVNLADAQAAAS